MNAPKHVVCFQGIEGFAADFGNLKLAQAYAINNCPAGGEAYVLSPAKTVRRSKGGKVSVFDSEVVESAEERKVVADKVIQRILKRGKVS